MGLWTLRETGNSISGVTTGTVGRGLLPDLSEDSLIFLLTFLSNKDRLNILQTN